MEIIKKFFEKRYDNCRDLLDEASDLEEEAQMVTTGTEEADELISKAAGLRAGAQLNKQLRDSQYVGWLLSDVHYFFTTYRF